MKPDGLGVVDGELVPMACVVDAVKKSGYQADYLVALACDFGICTFQALFPYKIVVSALDKMRLGARDVQGNIFVMKKF